MNKTPVVLTIAGSDSGGGAGVEADVKTFAALGVHGTCAITSVTSQNTTGVLSSYDIPPDVVADQIDAVCIDMDIEYAKTGMLASPDIVLAVAECIKKYNLLPVVDPVMAAEAGGELLTKDALSFISDELLPLSKVVTPNIYETSALSGISIKNNNDARNAATIIGETGVRTVIITGGHFDASDLVYETEKEKFTVISGEFIKGGTHGSGCTYSAALAAYLAQGFTIVDAARRAKRFVEHAIEGSVPVGTGVPPVNQMSHIRRNAACYHVLQDMEMAVEMIKNCISFPYLIPEVGSNIAMAIPQAVNVEDVAAVAGRIVKLKNTPAVVGCVEFGASSHVARIILAAMQSDTFVRAAMNVRYSKKVIRIIGEMGLKVSYFDRAEEPAHTSTMDWGVTHAIEIHGSVPDVIYDEGGVGKEPMVRILGKNATEVAGIAMDIANRFASSRSTH
ncbi:MAG: bifunctional hydroxymethylpyrimidine kinase/phosphomethylpyrimidine kinase [Methanosarcinaceae archaeon]|nr:bifunctional hydroxymethylpyrimidine kinase/phosphomethylpyrimidine kinase [Methanosarcinaceae archaeon]